MAKSKEFIERLPEMAWRYIMECMGKDEEGNPIKGFTSRHIPTIGYFLRIWLPLNNFTKDQEACGRLNGETITRKTWYHWLAEKREDGKENIKCDTIKEIDELFRELAVDVVANEGKGIFYAKNRLGMTDKQELSGNKEQPLFGPDVNK